MKQVFNAARWFGLVVVFGAMAPRVADAQAAEPRYKFAPNEDVMYEIAVQVEFPDETKVTTGYLVLHPKSVDATNGQITLAYHWAIKETTLSKGDQTSTQANASIADALGSAAGGPEVMIDSRGTIVHEEKTADSAQLDALQGPAWHLVLQPLPPAGQDSWTAHQQLEIYRIEKSGPDPAPARPFGPFGPFGPFNHGPAQPQNTTRIESPADENITYSARAPQGDGMTIARKYDLATLEKVGDKPVQHVSGDGHYLFDLKSGSVSQLDWNLVQEVTAKNVNVRIPITVSAHRLSAAETATLKTDIAEAGARRKDREAASRMQFEHMVNGKRILTLPAADAQAAQFKAIVAGWHQHGTGRELLPDMQGVHIVPEAGQPVALQPGQKLTTPKSFKPPVTFQIIAFTNLADTRIGYAFDQIVFNWEMRPDELRVDGGPGGGLHPKPGAGQLPINQWVGIEMTVTPTEMILYVNGKEIDRMPGDYSSIDKPFFIDAHNGPIDVQSIEVIK